MGYSNLNRRFNHVELKTTKENKGSPELEVHINNGFSLPCITSGFRRFSSWWYFLLAAILSFPLLQPHDAYAAAAEAH